MFNKSAYSNLAAENILAVTTKQVEPLRPIYPACFQGNFPAEQGNIIYAVVTFYHRGREQKRRKRSFYELGAEVSL